MKTTNSKLFAILTVGVVALTTTSALAHSGGNGNGNKGNKGGGSFHIGIALGGPNNGGQNNGGCNNGHCNNGGYNNGGYNTCQTNGGVYGQAFEPFHSTYICLPGDSFYTVSLKEYGTSANQFYVAKFNGFAPNAALVPGQRLVLPTISANGQLTVSNRPAGVGDTTPVQGPFSTPTTTSNLTQTASSFASTLASAVKPAATEPALPKVTVGSTLVLDGQVFGEAKGVARLRISGLSLPVEVLEWSNTSAKVQLPKVELTSPTKVELEVLRADGSLASKSAIELTPAADRLASTN